ncbi:hypothetical protein B0H17DRAFT_1213211 [Mycena rosella]|uniref:Uncharacterized protein n=1 Tax=Mycena rosella TaxID=1033263 RepID=A0AAD7CQJ7_MYCRO|nr:hypothetical protein B0H17DRAFT_1213211 [Mycena rosella]
MANINLNAIPTLWEDFELVYAVLAIEKEQAQLREMLVNNPLDSASGRLRACLAQKLQDLRARQVQRTPALESLMDDINGDTPEDARLFLPSQYQAIQRQELGLQALAHAEYVLRVGRAEDRLYALALLTRAGATLKQRRNQTAEGFLAVSKMQRQMDSYGRRIRAIAAAYNVHRSALLQLGLPANNVKVKRLRRGHLSGALAIF